MSWQNRNLLIASTELKRIATNLNLPEHVKEEAMRLYREAFKMKLLRGRSINGMIAACIYYACRKKGVPRTFQEVLDQSTEKPRDVRRCYRAIIKELNLRVPNTDPVSLVPKYIASLNLSLDMIDLVMKIIKVYKLKLPTSGKDPKGIVAGALYLACKLNNKELTQKQIADAIGVTEVTLRSRYKEFEKLNIKF
jgi:transcription initiation factor TFIIB